MSIGTWFRNGVAGLAGSSRGTDSTWRATQANLENTAATLVDPRRRYAVLRAYYFQNNLYDTLARQLYESGIWNRAVKAMRNPAYRIVEAYPAHLWPGDLPDALPIQTDNARIIEPIQQVWAWSNWASKKQLVARWLPMLGDCFVQVAERRDAAGQAQRVYFQIIDPAHVVDFDTDERGFLTWARLEVPSERRRSDGTLECYLHVAIWSKDLQTFRRWEVDTKRASVTSAWPETQLGTPTEEIPFSAMGITFVPIVHLKFLDVGEPRGIGAYLLQLDKIDMVNAEATRLSQLLFRHNQATWALHGFGNDPSGRPLPAPRINPSEQTGDGSDDSVSWRDQSVWRIPGNGQLTALVPNLNYEAFRLVNNDGLLDLQQDCPEMAYWRITEMGPGDITGRALRFMLGPFIKRVLEARGNAEDNLARLDAMALTIAAHAKLQGFTALGNYDAGDFEHQFAPRDVIPLGDLEEAQADQARADAANKFLTAGWSQAGVFRGAGLSQAEIDEMQTEKASQDVVIGTEQ